MSTNFDSARERVKNEILAKLYVEQLKYWNRKLRALQADNTASQGRGLDHANYQIFFRGKRWGTVALNWDPQTQWEYCLPLNTSIPEFVKRMEEIADEFEELTEEKYEAERFLSNLVLFNAPPERFRAILGSTLYRVAQKSIERAFTNSEDDWELNNEFSLRTFVESNQEIIAKMNQRVMINLVTL